MVWISKHLDITVAVDSCCKKQSYVASQSVVKEICTKYWLSACNQGGLSRNSVS